MDTCIVIGKGTTQQDLDRSLELYPKSFLAIDTQPTNQINLKSTRYASVSLHRIIFGFKGAVVFLNARDFNSSSHLLKIQHKVLILNKEDIPKVNRDIKNTEIFIRTKTNIRKAKNAELQSILR